MSSQSQGITIEIHPKKKKKKNYLLQLLNQNLKKIKHLPLEG